MKESSRWMEGFDAGEVFGKVVEAGNMIRGVGKRKQKFDMVFHGEDIFHRFEGEKGTHEVEMAWKETTRLGMCGSVVGICFCFL